MAIEKIKNIDEEYSDRIEELSNSTDTEWRASHKELKEKLWTLEKQITSVHCHVFLQSKHAVQGESKNNNDVIYVENQPKTYNDEDPEKYRCDQCNLGFLKKWILGKHVKDIHKEDKINDQLQMAASNAYIVNTQGSIRESLPREGNIYNNQPYIEDPVINIEDVQGFLGDSFHVANKNMHNSDDKDIQ